MKISMRMVVKHVIVQIKYVHKLVVFLRQILLLCTYLVCLLFIQLSKLGKEIYFVKIQSCTPAMRLCPQSRLNHRRVVPKYFTRSFDHPEGPNGRVRVPYFKISTSRYPTSLELVYRVTRLTDTTISPSHVRLGWFLREQFPNGPG
jgi:hypothetical protein